jgi:hypothetical protein
LGTAGGGGREKRVPRGSQGFARKSVVAVLPRVLVETRGGRGSRHWERTQETNWEKKDGKREQQGTVRGVSSPGLKGETCCQLSSADGAAARRKMLGDGVRRGKDKRHGKRPSPSAPSLVTPTPSPPPLSSSAPSLPFTPDRPLSRLSSSLISFPVSSESLVPSYSLLVIL